MTFVFVIIGAALVLGVGGTYFLHQNEKKAKKKGRNKTAAGKVGKSKGLFKTSTWLTIYDRLDRFFLSRKALRKIHQQLLHLSVYNSVEARVKAANTFLFVYGITVGTVVLTIVLFKDAFVVLVMCLIMIVVKDILIDKNIDKIHFQLLKELLIAISNLRQSYLRLNSIADAISEAEVHPMLRRSFDEIHGILTGEDADRRLQEFYNTTPFKLLRTLASICFKLDSTGDTKLPGGSSSFLLSISMLTTEAQMEVRRITNQRMMFGILEYLPVAPIILVPAIEAFFSNTIPGTTIVYNGFMGYVFQIIIIVSCIIGYTTVSRINSVSAIKQDDRTLMSLRILSNRKAAKFIYNITPKSLKRMVRANNALRGSLSAKELKHLYADKLLMSVSAFIGSIIVFIFALILGKDFVYNNYQELSMMPSDPLTVEEYQIKKNMDGEYLANPTMPDYDYSYALVKKYYPRYSQLKVEDEIGRMELKYKSYNDTFFKWWHLLVCIIISILAWYFPNLMLKFRKSLAKAEAEEDVLQLQTIISILTTTTADTLEALEWMMKQSEIHKNPLIDTFHEYPSDPEKSLNKLKAKVTTVEFKRIIDKLLLTIHQMSLSEAFSDLIEEREHTMRIREMTQDKALKKKRSMCKPVSLLPLAMVVLLYFLMPLAYLGYMEFVDAMSKMDF